MKRVATKRKHFLPRIDLDWKNLVLFLIGLVVLIIGFILVSIPPWDNPISLSVAPLVLLLGYLVIFPLAILYKKRDKRNPAESRRNHPD